MFVSCLCFGLVGWGLEVSTYEHDGRERHSFELDGELVAGLELCGCFVWSLGGDGADEALCPLRYAWEVEELCSF